MSSTKNIFWCGFHSYFLVWHDQSSAFNSGIPILFIVKEDASSNGATVFFCDHPVVALERDFVLFHLSWLSSRLLVDLVTTPSLVHLILAAAIMLITALVPARVLVDMTLTHRGALHRDVFARELPAVAKEGGIF
jgi:hypothetical protein